MEPVSQVPEQDVTWVVDPILFVVLIDAFGLFRTKYNPSPATAMMNITTIMLTVVAKARQLSTVIFSLCL
ncbi:MAG: hypothetical protein M1368_09460, partial [Thaumarchaeota archaeon]|nr:hypothetical protein [Nitrososphaerota archaeon]